MLSPEQRAELVARMRRGREGNVPGRIGRRGDSAVPPPASFSQEQLWFLDRFAPGQATYTIPVVLRLSGALDRPALERALDRLVERHEVLRTRLILTEDPCHASTDLPPKTGLVQVIAGAGRPVLEEADLSGFAAGKREDALREFVLREALRPFDLAAGPLLRTCLVLLGEADQALVVVVHHAVFDGWSAGVLVRDLAALYGGEATGEPPGLGELAVQFADYAVWERDSLRGQRRADLESYWRGVLAGFETVQFPADRPRPLVDGPAGALAERLIGPGLLAGLGELSQREGVTLFTTLMAAVLALLHRYTGQDDLVVGTFSANRGRPELAPLIGFLVNTLPIRCDLSGDPAFRAVLARVKEATMGAFAHQDLPFGQLVDALRVERDASRTPVFQIAFSYAERDATPVHAAGVGFLRTDLVRGINAAKFDLTFAAEVRPEGLWFECTYKTALFDPATIERLLGHLETLLHGVAADPAARLSQLPLLTEADRRAEIDGWNDTAAPVPSSCLHEVFQAQAARHPEAIAAEYEDERVTYGQLNRQANQIARRLRDLGIGPDMPTGVCLPPSLRRLAVLLGILKAGGGYVPLDPALPAERLSFMIADAGITVVVTGHGSLPGALDIDAEWDQLSLLSGDDLEAAGITPASLAYVIYTSGSTGQPKGVMIEHRNVVNLVHGRIEAWGIGPGSAVLQYASYAFDMSVLDIFVSLLSGARLVLVPPRTLHSPARLAALIRESGVTYANLPTAVLDLLPAGDYPDLRVLSVGGEAVPADLARRWIRPGLRLVNGYGPTEATAIAVIADLDATTPMPPPIGFPVHPNYRAYVLDRHLNPVPAGVFGELHIGGAGLARGYLNRPELTRERFIPDPFRPGERLYKSGDLVRRRPDGSLEFAGRIDTQVKIRGVRIELGEIEAVLAAHPGIAQAVVTVVAGTAGDQDLAAYVRFGAGPVSEQDLRAHLARTLPAVMIPAYFVPVETFPLNSSSKVDKKALPVPRRQPATEPAAPQTPAEATLAGLYATLLGTGPVGVTDSFFDLGGNSLTAMRLVDQIGRQTGADISVTSIFLHPTPRQLAAVIDGESRIRAPWVELSGGQAGPPLFLIHAVGGTVSAYAPLGRELADVFTVYGLESPALGDPALAADSLAGLVADYTRRIRSLQPDGPYALGGWSMGGVIAFEVARSLERAGADVALLVLLDAPFALPAGSPAGDAELAARFVEDAACSLGMDTAGAPDPATTPPAGQLDWLARRLAGGEGIEAQLQRRLDVFAAHHRILAGYQPAGDRLLAATLIVSASRSLNAPARAHWPGQLDGQVSVLSVDSDHYAFLRPPLVEGVGAAIRRRYRRLEHRERTQMLSERELAALTARLRRDRAPGSGPSQITPRGPGPVPPPASFGQEQLWFVDKLAPGQAIYNVPCLIHASGPLDAPALARALDRLAARHEALRTRLVPDAQSRPVQVVDPPRSLALAAEDFTAFEPGKRRTRLREYIQAEAMRPFDLAAGPLLRASLVRLAETEHLLAAVVHHAVFDGWSAGVLVRDLAALYAAEATGEPSGLADLPVQFADYAVWERQRLDGQVLAGLQAYWRDKMTGFEAVEFPADRPRPVIDDFTGAIAERTADAALLASLRAVSQREGTTLFVTLLASLLALLHRYTGQDDLVIGTVSANRGRAELAPLIGFLVNTLPIRCDLSGDPRFRDVLAQVKETSIGAFAHQDLPFAKLVDTLGVDRDPGRTPVCQIVFTFAERAGLPVPGGGVDFTPSDLVLGLPAAQFDLAFVTEARPDGLWFECSYKTALFDRDTIERLLGNLEVLVRGAAADPAARLSQLPLLTGAELQAELHDWNDTAAPVPAGCVHERFEAQAARSPEAIAASYEGQQISYQQLNRQANQVARRLRALGAGPEVLTGVCMRTGLRRLAALLATWKAGGGYVPLDPDLPADRLAFMIGDAGISVVLTDDDCAGSVPAAGAVNLDTEWDQLARLPGDDLAGTGVTPGCVAYVMYTSGSTGQPKGVILEHRHVVNALSGMTGRFGIGPADRVLQFASFAFDASVQDTFMPLLAGAQVVLAAAPTLHSPRRLAALMREARITVACLPPAVLDLLPSGHYPDLRILMPGGEELSAELARRWIRPGLRLVNSYGPTEATIDATYADIDAATRMPPPIGFPAGPNYRAYVLDRYLNPVPAGVVGELHIGGASVARGYLSRPELTRERFIPDPFVPGERLYKTGDLARRRPDGSIMFLGRIDGQVKVRGLRIELGEIESALAAHPAVAQAIAVVVTSPAGEKEIAAYLRSGSGPLSEPDLLAHLARTLPAWMVPPHLIQVETFPLSPNGKVDRRALPVPRRRAPAPEAAPATAAEATLTRLYATLMHLDKVSVNDSFFDLGGNSLTAMRLVDLIGQETGADISVTSVFLHPTPRRLAASLEITGGNPLVVLGGAQAEPPLFLVHAIEGTVSAYTPLAQELGDAFRVYGLESPALNDPALIPSSLADLVTGYTRRIRAAQPDGPYALGGWSMGGVIAFEIARRLQQAGARVDLLVLLDAPFAIPADLPPPPQERAQLSGTRWLNVFDAHHRLIAGYQPSAPPVRAPTLIVSATRSLNAVTRTQWPGLLSGPVSVLPVDSDHYAFLRPPLAAAVAAAIRTWHDNPREA